MKSSKAPAASGRIAACPQCGKSTRLDPQNPWRPFCSERCKMVDLGAWFSEERGIPGDEPATHPPGNDRSDA
ncbi:MAG: DNA gyrase inhibitor YacG [Gammaproteobacteria bacterium]